MNRILTRTVAIAAAAGFAAAASAQSTIYFSDFETDGGGWEASGVTGDWERGIPVGFSSGISSIEPVGGFSGEFVWGTVIGGDHSPNADEDLTQKFDFTGLTDITLNFQEWISTGGATFDMAQVFVNGDSLYLSDGDSHEAWRPVSLDLNAYAGLSEVEITFNLLTTAVVERVGWYIDDVEITAVPTPGALALLGLGGLAVARRRR